MQKCYIPTPCSTTSYHDKVVDYVNFHSYYFITQNHIFFNLFIHFVCVNTLLSTFQFSL